MVFITTYHFSRSPTQQNKIPRWWELTVAYSHYNKNLQIRRGRLLMLMHAIAVTKINITRTSTSTPPTMPMIMSISFVSGEVEGCSAPVAGVLVLIVVSACSEWCSWWNNDTCSYNSIPYFELMICKEGYFRLFKTMLIALCAAVFNFSQSKYLYTLKYHIAGNFWGA